MIDYYSLSDVGLKRAKNEDSYLTIQNDNGDFLAIVCDGIGGANAGDVASSELTNYFKEHFKDAPKFSSLDNARNYLLYHLKLANKHIYNLSKQNIEYYGMGTTITGLLITGFGILSINAGDSRTYGYNRKELLHLTYDHTYVNQMVEKGEITYEESLTHPKRHYLIRAVGVWEDVEFDVHRVRKMNYYLICSDGLCGYVSDKEIETVLANSEFLTCADKSNELLRLALSKGGYDNVTIIVMKLYENRK